MRLSGQGIAPHLVVLTDGRANIDREGRQGRAQAAADARAAAEACRRAGLVATVIDTGARPRAEARDIADALGARYLPMPRAEADALCRALSSAG